MSETDQTGTTIEPLQVWDIGVGEPMPLRRIKILAKHPEQDDMWIYEEMPGAVFHTEVGRIGLFPEFNLKFMESKGQAAVCQQ